ncbi:cation diffusion facilitator family transporter [Aliikangiella sp. IMCC44359]|uniref:cation diffusion facilitator family transporter n=1 Tax=Aliikangiella sp. IMCC44359 TaxID=3459125 RepID=UPI00403AA285
MHTHSSAEHESSNRIGWAFVLNLSYTVIEFIGGLLTNSTAIMADAVHDLGDSISIGLAWVLNKLGAKEADETYTYGYQRFTLLGALINGVVLLVGSIWIISIAIPKLQNPEMPVVEGMLGLAIFGVLVNGFAAFKLSRGKTLNERVLNWHLLEDVLGWIAVLILSIVLMFFEAPILDPILSLAFTLFILFNVAKNLVLTIRTFLQATPDKKVLNEIRNRLVDFNLVESVHHLHFWSLDGEHHVLTGHLVLGEPVTIDALYDLRTNIEETLKPYSFKHTTLEFEFYDDTCRDS